MNEWRSAVDRGGVPREDEKVNRLEIALVVIVIVLGSAFRWAETSSGWFWADDWRLLARDLGSLNDWLRPHAGHWNTVPILVYHMLFELFGLDYFPAYHAFRIMGHAVFAAVFWGTLRWRGGNRWTSLVVVGMVVVLSSSYEYKPITIGIWVAAPALVISATLVERRDEPTRRDQGFVAAMLLLAVMSTSIGAIGTVALLVVVAIHRRWIWTPPLLYVLGVYAIWYLKYGTEVIPPNTSLTDSTNLEALPANLLDLLSHSLERVFLPETGIRQFPLACLLAIGTGLAWVSRRRGSIGLMPTAMLITVVLYYVGIHVTRLGSGLATVETPRFANTPFFLLLPAFIGALPRPKTALGTITTLTVGALLVVGQAQAFSTDADALLVRQDRIRTMLVVARQMVLNGKPVHPDEVELFGRAPFSFFDAQGWPVINEIDPGTERRVRGLLRVKSSLDLPPLAVLPKELVNRDFAPLLVDGDPLEDCINPAGRALTFRDQVAFRVQVATDNFADGVRVVTSDSFGEGVHPIRNANFAVITVLAPEGDTSTLRVNTDRTVNAICPFGRPADGG